MKKKFIIGFFGPKGTGKTTAADYLVKEHGFNKVSFKDGLIEEIKEKFPDLLAAIQEEYSGETGENIMTTHEMFRDKPPLIRALMQNYGTEVRRGDDPNYWVKIAKKKIKETKSPIVVDDVRFFNELSALTEMDAVFVRLTRDDITVGTDHQSETEQQKFIEDFEIKGEAGSHKALYKALDSVLDTIKSNND